MKDDEPQPIPGTPEWYRRRREEQRAGEERKKKGDGLDQ